MMADVQDFIELRQLNDQLNLSHKVRRIGEHFVISGGFAEIWEGELEDGQRVAVKVLRQVNASFETLKRRLVRELRAWHKLEHRNVLPLLGYAHGFRPGQLVAGLVSPWMDRGTVIEYLKDNLEADRYRLMTEVADGLYYLHRHDVVHGDLKGGNILINSHGKPRLADFGLSKLIDETSTPNTSQTHTGIVGSIRWMARELCNMESEVHPIVSSESDVWAYGMTILEIWTLQAPYSELGFNDVHVYYKIFCGVLPKYPSSPIIPISDDLWELCLDCWKEHPELRPTMREIARRMWDLETKSRNKRPPPDSDVDSGSTSTSASTPVTTDSEASPRPRKSPRLAFLDDLDPKFSKSGPPSPGPQRSPRLRSSLHSPSRSSSSSSRMQRRFSQDINPADLPSSYRGWDRGNPWSKYLLPGRGEPSSPFEQESRPRPVTPLARQADLPVKGAMEPDVPLLMRSRDDDVDHSRALVPMWQSHVHGHTPPPLRGLTRDEGVSSFLTIADYQEERERKASVHQHHILGFRAPIPPPPSREHSESSTVYEYAPGNFMHASSLRPISRVDSTGTLVDFEPGYGYGLPPSSQVFKDSQPDPSSGPSGLLFEGPHIQEPQPWQNTDLFTGLASHQDRLDTAAFVHGHLTQAHFIYEGPSVQDSQLWGQRNVGLGGDPHDYIDRSTMFQSGLLTDNLSEVPPLFEEPHSLHTDSHIMNAPRPRGNPVSFSTLPPHAFRDPTFSDTPQDFLLDAVDPSLLFEGAGDSPAVVAYDDFDELGEIPLFGLEDSVIPLDSGGDSSPLTPRQDMMLLPMPSRPLSPSKFHAERTPPITGASLF